MKIVGGERSEDSCDEEENVSKIGGGNWKRRCWKAVFAEVVAVVLMEATD